MQVAPFWAVFGLALLPLSACGDSANDPFFKAGYDKWVENARKLSTEKVYELYKKQINMPPPSEPTLAVVLGERGKQSVDIMINDLMNGNNEIIKGYYPLLSEVRQRSNFNFCTEGNYYYKINRALEKGFGISYPQGQKYSGSLRTAFDRMCGRMVGLSP